MAHKREHATTGRKTKLNPRVQEALIEAITAGATYEHAAQYAGISFQTLYNWLDWGRAGKSPWLEFLEAFQKAEIRVAVMTLAQIRSAAREDWRAGAWILEHRFPDHYGRRTRDADVVHKVAFTDPTGEHERTPFSLPTTAEQQAYLEAFTAVIATQQQLAHAAKAGEDDACGDAETE